MATRLHGAPPIGRRGPQPGPRLRAALADAAEGALHWPQWFTLGNLDIRLRFRRTGLGPIWTTLSFSILVAAIGFVYARVLGEEVRDYLPYLVLGLFAWSFVAAVLLEACDAFVHAEQVLKQIDVPRTAFVYRLVWRNLVLLAFNLVPVAAVLAWSGAAIPPSAPLALAGLLLLCANLAWMALLLALAAARFRGVSRIVYGLLPVGMLATPVIWRPASEELRRIVEWNPFHHAIELVRGPVLGAPPALAVWIAAAALALAGGFAALAALAAWRGRLTYWL